MNEFELKSENDAVLLVNTCGWVDGLGKEI